jgi:hypothetical protein
VFALGEQTFVIVLIHDRMTNVCPYQIIILARKLKFQTKMIVWQRSFVCRDCWIRMPNEAFARIFWINKKEMR